MIIKDKITEIFCVVDEFCKKFNEAMDKKSLMQSPTANAKLVYISIETLFWCIKTQFFPWSFV